MTSIVLQLQELASSRNHDITDLLHKSLIVATKLKLEEFRAWIKQELDGYSDAEAVPEYRRMRSELRAHNPIHGAIPFRVDSAEMLDLLTQVAVMDSASAMQELIANGQHEEVCYYFSPKQETTLMRMQQRQAGYAFRPFRVVSKHAFSTILGVVRTRILEWSLELEQKGILGEGYSFSERERKAAMAERAIHIQNFQGVLGDVHGGTVSQSNAITVQKGDFESLSSYLEKTGIPAKTIHELRQAVVDDPHPTSAAKFGPGVSKWIGKMVGLAASGGWEISVSSAGTLLAAAIATYYGLPK